MKPSRIVCPPLRTSFFVGLIPLMFQLSCEMSVGVARGSHICPPVEDDVSVVSKVLVGPDVIEMVSVVGWWFSCRVTTVIGKCRSMGIARRAIFRRVVGFGDWLSLTFTACSFRRVFWENVSNQPSI